MVNHFIREAIRSNMSLSMASVNENRNRKCSRESVKKSNEKQRYIIEES